MADVFKGGHDIRSYTHRPPLVNTKGLASARTSARTAATRGLPIEASACTAHVAGVVSLCHSYCRDFAIDRP